MNVLKIRLYRKMDRDLITLYRHPSFSLPKAILSAITMSYTKDAGYIELPKPYVLDDIPKKVEFTVELEDEGLQDWVRKIPAGTRNDAVKQIVRGYLSGPFLPALTNNKEDANNEFFNSPEKPMIQAKKSESEISAEYDKELEKISDILHETNMTPNEILERLTDIYKEKEEKERKEHRDMENKTVLKPETKPESKKEKKEKPASAEASEPVSEQLTLIPEPAQSDEPDTDDDFNLMAAFAALK